MIHYPGPILVCQKKAFGLFSVGFWLGRVVCRGLVCFEAPWLDDG